jgi:nucleoside-diphosphate-sugar epimerase
MHPTFFITGATGYLGSKIIHRLNNLGGSFYCLKRKSSNTYRVSDIESRINWINAEDFEVASFFERNHVDSIIHCATDYGRKLVDPFQIIEANLTLPLKLLHYGSIAGVNSFINTDTVLDKKIDVYSLSKKQFLDWLERYSKRIVAVNVALQHFYGPGDDPTKFTTHIIKSLISSVPRLKLTAGEQNRDFIYIDDVVNAFTKIIEASIVMNRGYHGFEVGTGKRVQLKDFVTLVKNIIENNGTILDFGALPYRPGEVMDIETNPTKVIGLGWVQKFTLEQGLSLTIAEERLRQE